MRLPPVKTQQMHQAVVDAAAQLKKAADVDGNIHPNDARRIRSGQSPELSNLMHEVFERVSKNAVGGTSSSTPSVTVKDLDPDQLGRLMGTLTRIDRNKSGTVSKQEIAATRSWLGKCAYQAVRFLQEAPTGTPSKGAVAKLQQRLTQMYTPQRLRQQLGNPVDVSKLQQLIAKDASKFPPELRTAYSNLVGGLVDGAVALARSRNARNGRKLTPEHLSTQLLQRVRSRTRSLETRSPATLDDVAKGAWQLATSIDVEAQTSSTTAPNDATVRARSRGWVADGNSVIASGSSSRGGFVVVDGGRGGRSSTLYASSGHAYAVLQGAGVRSYFRR